ncbi:hypothetical protein QFC21_006735 [Naganishia friedmannii]|uniref:Uncharacterized protein n=1 Tax=Naganishia friedmannii TaxID=89922 RepID=A0ACC2V158_9TREE|nr:hypothetical protein QFC21_006735 [Naganishia friedmannii]
MIAIIVTSPVPPRQQAREFCAQEVNEMDATPLLRQLLEGLKLAHAHTPHYNVDSVITPISAETQDDMTSPFIDANNWRISREAEQIMRGNQTRPPIVENSTTDLQYSHVPIAERHPVGLRHGAGWNVTYNFEEREVWVHHERQDILIWKFSLVMELCKEAGNVVFE